MKSLRKGDTIVQAYPSDQNFSFLRMAAIILSQLTSINCSDARNYTERNKEEQLTELTPGPVVPHVTVTGVIIDGFHTFSVATAWPGLTGSFKEIRKKSF